MVVVMTADLYATLGRFQPPNRCNSLEQHGGMSWWGSLEVIKASHRPATRENTFGLAMFPGVVILIGVVARVVCDGI